MNTTNPTRKRLPRLFIHLAGTLLAVTILASILFLGAGGKVNVIETPSMATYTPVGSLVLTLPVDYATLQPGDPILFNVAGGEKAYFHRVLTVEPTGLTTQGDLNGTVDPWMVTENDVLGKEIFHAPGLGYLLLMLPVLVIGSILIYLFAFYYLAAYWKVPAYIFGGTLLASVVNFLYHPFVKVNVLSQVLVDGVATTTFVPTGLWSLDGHAFGGTSTYNVQPGQIGTITSITPDPAGQFSVSLEPHMEPWVWAVLSLVWVLPAVLGVGYFLYARAKGLDLLPPEDTAEVEQGPAGLAEPSTMESSETELAVVKKT